MRRNRPIDLYGTPTGNCLRAAIALEEAGIPYRPLYVDLSKGEQHGPDVIKLNPGARVPILVDYPEGETPLVVTQSNAILHYVAGQVPGALWPTGDERAIALAHERLLYFITDVIAPSHAAFRLGKGHDEARALLTRRSLDALEAAERFASTSPFMAGPVFTLADVAALTITHSSRDELNWAGLPRHREWYEKVITRPAVQRGMHAFDRPEAT